MPDREVEAPSHELPRRGAGFYVGAILSAIFLVRLLGASWDSHFPAVWPDATFANQGYLAVAAKSPFRPSFYNAFRPIGYPLLLWVFGRNTQLTVVAQASLYCVGVGALKHLPLAKRLSERELLTVVQAAPDVIAGALDQEKVGAIWEKATGAPVPLPSDANRKLQSPRRATTRP